MTQNNNLQNMLRNATVNTEVQPQHDQSHNNISIQNLLSNNVNQNLGGIDQESYIMQNLYQQQSVSSLEEPIGPNRPMRVSNVTGEHSTPFQNFLRNPSVACKTDLQVIKEEKKRAKDEPVRSCRICLCEEGEGKKDDPIVSPCHCKGFSGDIHIKCL